MTVDVGVIGILLQDDQEESGGDADRIGQLQPTFALLFELFGNNVAIETANLYTSSSMLISIIYWILVVILSWSNPREGVFAFLQFHDDGRRVDKQSIRMLT